jgi:DNA-binding beta-propeller fold protein YncE
MNTNNFWVLDQGQETIYEVQKNKLQKPRAIKKKDNFFTSLVGVCSMPNGDILFTDSRLNKVFIIDHDKKKLASLNDTLQFQQPTGIAYSAASGEIWVVETGAHRVSVLGTNGELIKRIGNRGEENGQFNFPTSIWIDKDGDVYIVDAMNFRVQIFHKNGDFVTAFGEEGDASGTFARPKGIATDTYGNIYVADALFHVVQIFDRSGNFLYSFGKQGREKEEFWMPSGIFIDSKNYIYVADSYNSRVQIFQLVNGSNGT